MTSTIVNGILLSTVPIGIPIANNLVVYTYKPTYLYKYEKHSYVIQLYDKINYDIIVCGTHVETVQIL